MHRRIRRDLTPATVQAWRTCRQPDPQGRGYCCTVRVTAGHDTHTGDHVAGGRAAGELDSDVLRWVQ